MAEGFLSLSSGDRTEALLVAASNSGRPVHILEKDVWVVWALHSLFDSGFGNQLVFKGGTSLSKVYKAIERFSEDIDVTYDIRAIAQEWVKDSGDEPVPETRSQGKRWTDTIRERLPKWLAGTVIPHIEKRITSQKLEAKARLEENCIHIEYAHSTEGYDYVSPRVKIEFGARSSGEPVESRQIVCDAAEFLPTLTFPIPVVRVMRVERTAWEKMTAIHVFCEQENIKDRLSRHWYDIAKLDVSGYIDAALKDRDIARRVADHKSWAFGAKDARGNVIAYHSVINGALTLIPQGKALEALATDYAKMIEDRLFAGTPESFEWVLERCRDIERRANATGGVHV